MDRCFVPRLVSNKIFFTFPNVPINLAETKCCRSPFPWRDSNFLVSPKLFLSRSQNDRSAYSRGRDIFQLLFYFLHSKDRIRTHISLYWISSIEKNPYIFALWVFHNKWGRYPEKTRYLHLKKYIISNINIFVKHF